MKTNRYGYADLICYALSVVEEIQDEELRNFKEAIEEKESQYWLPTMNEEM